MSTTAISAVDIHSEHITLDALQQELRINPWRLEEKKGGNGWQSTDEGNTPLISSAEFGNLQECEFLLSVGANIEAKNTVCSSSSIENESVNVYQCFFW